MMDGNEGESESMTLPLSSHSQPSSGTSGQTSQRGNAVDAEGVHGATGDAGHNKAVEIHGDSLKMVDVSRHPEPSIPISELSLADIERKRAKPLPWLIFLLLILVAIIAPYWLGRSLAVHKTKAIVTRLLPFSYQGIALVAWAVTVIAFIGLALALIESHSWFWRIVLLLGLSAEQFIGGVSLLKFDFWYSTYVVYSDASNLVNAANLGIISAVFGAAAFAVLFVGLLVVVRKDSPFNVLTHSWAAFIMFFVIELTALGILLFGSFLSVL